MSVIGSSIVSFQVALAAGGTAQAVEPTAGEVPGTDNPVFGDGYVGALVGNTSSLYIGPLGVTAATGYELQKGTSIRLSSLGFGRLYFVGATTGDKLCVIGEGP